MATAGNTGLAAQPRILVVEDERIVALDLAATLCELGYCVVGMAARGEEAIERARELDPNLILMDVRLGGSIDGIQAAEIIRRSRDIPVIYLTAHSDNETLLRAANTAASGYLVKPFKSPELRSTIEIALHKHAADARVREHEQWLTTTLHYIAEAVIATDTDGYVRLFNPVAENLTGWAQQDAKERSLNSVLSLVDEDSGRPLENILQQALESKSPMHTPVGASLVSRSGERIAIEETAAPIVDPFGRILGGVLVLRDITERRHQINQIQQLNEELEERVNERTAELATANRDLESFSYSVAHDLRAPLRSIDSFSTLLVQNHAAQLDAQGTAYLNRIRSAALRMSQLIDDLLTLAGTGRGEFRPMRINLSSMARDLLSDLAVNQGSHSVTTHVDDEMLALADSRLMRVALSNLLDNAWKFTRGRSDAHVAVYCRIVEGVRTYSVSDNGAGFDPRYASKLFGAFQRLHSEREFPGTGIGLAIVDRVIRRHGGKIWAESEPDHGATFYFTLPDPMH